MVSKDFDGVHALRHVSFSMPVGQHLAIIGPNGAGKTTLAKIISGHLPASAGRLYLFNQEITKLPAYRRVSLGISQSFQITNLFPKLTILVNALLALEGVRHSKFHMYRPLMADKDLMESAQGLLRAWDLWDMRDQLVSEVSYGAQRKLEIVLGLASNPRLLLLDEPNSGLTEMETNEIVDMIGNLKENISVLLIAHDMDVVFRAAQRIIVLHSGEMIADGTPAEIQENSLVRDVYLGSGGS
jgi:branched-chain amino acid transport system ATP-binding protein